MRERFTRRIRLHRTIEFPHVETIREEMEITQEEIPTEQEVEDTVSSSNEDLLSHYSGSGEERITPVIGNT